MLDGPTFRDQFAAAVARDLVPVLRCVLHDQALAPDPTTPAVYQCPETGCPVRVLLSVEPGGGEDQEVT